MNSASKILEIGGVAIPSGSRKRIHIDVATLFDGRVMKIPVEVVRGKLDGPVLFVSAAIHGDEINGVETIKRLLSRRRINAKTLKGTLIAVPVVNAFGFNRNSRYLPDRRDLNRCFPGSKTGSLAAQIAHIFMTEVVEKSTHGIDLHTGAIHRTNLPQIRACLQNEETNRLAHSFGGPVILDSMIPDGSLRQSAYEKGIPMLLFEGGEALRYEEKIIRSALMGIFSVMEAIGMIKESSVKKTPRKNRQETFVANSSYWVRASGGGSIRVRKHCGDHVKEGDVLGEISDPFGQNKKIIRTMKTGIIIGMTMTPLVNNGDAIFHIATFEDAGAVEERLGAFDESLELELEQSNELS